MADEHSIRRYRRGYAKLLRLYSKPYYERFGEGMEQTFNDLLRERVEEERGVFGYALWMFVETSAGIIREKLTFFIMQKSIIRLAVVTGLILLIPLVLTLLGSGVDGEGWHWTLSDFVFAGTLIFGTGLAYHLITRKAGTVAYRAAVGMALAAAFLLVWFNAAVGVVGDSPGPMFFGVVAVLIIGALIARFRSRGMTYALSATALAQALVAVVAMIAWGQYVEISILNGFFIALWVGSALLFRRASATGSK